MNKKKLLNKNTICIFGLLLVVCIFINVKYIYQNNFKIQNNYEINTDPKYVRVYYDFATASSLYEVYDFLLQDKNSTVFLRWDRIPNLKEKLKDRKNVHVMEHFKNNDTLELNPKEIVEYYKAHPNSQFIIHTTHNWVINLLPTIYNLPKKAIKEIHIYEDGSYSSSLYNLDSLFHGLDLYELFHKTFKGIPVIFHMEDAEYLNSPRCLYDKLCIRNKKLHKNDIVVKSSISDLKEKLNANTQIKDEYFNIFSFDYKKYEKMMTHPFGVYTFAIWFYPKAAEQELKFMHELLYGKLRYLVKNENVKWFYKEHPHNYQRGSFSSTLSKTNPELIRIDKSIPLELFLIAGIVPDYVAGYSSSIYLNYPRKSICAYILRSDDVYMKIINRDHRIRPGRIFELTDTDDTLKSKFRLIKSRILVFFQK